VGFQSRSGGSVSRSQDPGRPRNSLRDTSVLHAFLHPVLKALGFPQAGMHAFRHGYNRRGVLSGMNPAVLQMGHSSAVMAARVDMCGGCPNAYCQRASLAGLSIISSVGWRISTQT